jgi:hypothetical protein
VTQRPVPLADRMVRIVRRRGPISPHELQRRCRLPTGQQRIRLLIGPTLTGFSQEFCEVFCPLVWNGVLRLRHLEPGWKRGWRVVLGQVTAKERIA